MQWLQDKKNLPFVVGGIAVVVIAAAAFLFIQMRGRSAPSGTDVAQQPVQTDASGMPIPGGGSAPPVAPGAAPPAGIPGMPPGMPGMPGVPDAGAAQASAPVAEQDAKVTAKQEPAERWRPDPFFVPGRRTGPRRDGVVRPSLQIPPVPLIFPPVKKDPAKEFAQLTPQPPRRVAGVMFSDRVAAVMETPDGFETVRPGEKLRDGTMVERIERDRVVLRTVEDRPRLVEVKLAASINPVQPASTVTPEGPTLPGLAPPIYPAGRGRMTPFGPVGPPM